MKLYFAYALVVMLLVVTGICFAEQHRLGWEAVFRVWMTLLGLAGVLMSSLFYVPLSNFIARYVAMPDPMPNRVRLALIAALFCFDAAVIGASSYIWTRLQTRR